MAGPLGRGADLSQPGRRDRSDDGTIAFRDRAKGCGRRGVLLNHRPYDGGNDEGECEMTLSVASVMQKQVESVRPGMSVHDLERRLLRKRISGCPVVEDGKVVGIVSRSDVIRQLCIERTNVEMMSDYYSDFSGMPHEVPQAQSLDEIASQLGRRIGHLTVRDLMMEKVISVRSDDPLSRAAQVLVEKHIHRLPVIDDEQLVGIITSLDLVRTIADGRYVAAGKKA